MITKRTWLPGLFVLALVLPTQGQDATFRARSNVVTVPTLVKDDHGQVIYGLKPDDFIIEDEGTAQSVLLDQSAESEPVSVVVAVQWGRRASREFARMRGLASMLSPIFGVPGSQVALVEFDSEVRLVRDFTDNEDDIETPLFNLHAGDNGASILDAVQYSVRLLSQVPKEQ